MASLTARCIMSDKVVFFRPVEKVGVILDILMTCEHSNFPVVDTNDNDVLLGTIGRNPLCFLMKRRAFGSPKEKHSADNRTIRMLHNFLEHGDKKYSPLVKWETLEQSYPKYPSVEDIRLSDHERECYVDLRPYANRAPITVQEQASVQVSTCHFFPSFRSLFFFSMICL